MRAHAHTSDSVLGVRAKSEIVCTDTEEHFTIQPDSICVQHVDPVREVSILRVSQDLSCLCRETESLFVS